MSNVVSVVVGSGTVSRKKLAHFIFSKRAAMCIGSLMANVHSLE